MELAARNQSQASIERAVAWVDSEEFMTRTSGQLLVRLNHLTAEWEAFYANNNNLISAAHRANNVDEVAIHAAVMATVEPLYLEAKSAIYTRMQELAPQPADHGIQQQPAQAAPQQIVVTLQGKHNVENTWGDFDGTLTKWRGFRDLFTDRVHNDADLAPAYKFKLLKNSLTGNAATSLGDWELTDENYAEAWDRLNHLYDQVYITGARLMRKLNNLIKLEKPTGYHLQKMSNIGNEVYRQLRALQFPVEHVDFVFIFALHDRLDTETSTKWNLERNTERPTLINFLAFLDRQARALMGTQYNDNKVKDGKKRPSIAEIAHVTPKRPKHALTAHKPNEQNTCALCKETHALFKCAKFLASSLTARKQVVKTNNLCLNCLRAGHLFRDCSYKECFRCNIKHNSLLCPENPYNKVVASVSTENKVTTRSKFRKKSEIPASSTTQQQN